MPLYPEEYNKTEGSQAEQYQDDYLIMALGGKYTASGVMKHLVIHLKTEFQVVEFFSNLSLKVYTVW